MIRCFGWACMLHRSNPIGRFPAKLAGSGLPASHAAMDHGTCYHMEPMVHHTRLNGLSWIAAAGMLALLPLWAPAPAKACPMCADNLPEEKGLEAPERGEDLAAGFYYSILFMLAIPVSLVGGFSGWLYVTARREEEAASPPTR